MARCDGDSNQNRTPRWGVHRPVQKLVDSIISFHRLPQGEKKCKRIPYRLYMFQQTLFGESVLSLLPFHLSRVAFLAHCDGDSNQNRTPRWGVHRPVQKLVDSIISFHRLPQGEKKCKRIPYRDGESQHVLSGENLRSTLRAAGGPGRARRRRFGAHLAHKL